MSTILQAALLGAVQGITEFLPVSSTAHLLLGERLLGYQDAGGVFVVMIQLGSILAIMTLYRVKILDILRGLTSRPDAQHFALAIVLATVPALIAGALLSDFVTSVLYRRPGVWAAAFLVGGVVMLVVERAGPTPVVEDAERTPWLRALGVGLCQMLALIPGVSRSGATIVGGMAMGLDRPAAAEFSFFLAMPTLAAAFVHELLEVRQQLSPDRGLEIGIGLLAAFVASLVVIKPFLLFVRRSGFAPFAWYRIGVGLAIFAAMAAGWL
jgi:undecaprenyl-diphosphatase